MEGREGKLDGRHNQGIEARKRRKERKSRKEQEAREHSRKRHLSHSGQQVCQEEESREEKSEC
jgi:hypothetical protein